MNRKMKTLYVPAPKNSLLDNKTPSIIEVQGYEYEMEKHWVVPQLRQIFVEGHQIFQSREEAQEYQSTVIDRMILHLRARQGELDNSIQDVEIV